MVFLLIGLVDFFNHPFFSIIGGISTLMAIFGFVYGLFIIFNGVIPVWIRLGRSLSNRKIAVFADNHFDSLRTLLVDSELFKSENIIKIPKDSISKGKDYSIMLVNYSDFGDKIEDILQNKKDSDALIIYAPKTAGTISDDLLNKINDCRYSLIVNFRGRLINDIFTLMITTKYEKR